jgi:hypothetical protein
MGREEIQAVVRKIRKLPTIVSDALVIRMDRVVGF